MEEYKRALMKVEADRETLRGIIERAQRICDLLGQWESAMVKVSDKKGRLTRPDVGPPPSIGMAAETSFDASDWPRIEEIDETLRAYYDHLATAQARYATLSDDDKRFVAAPPWPNPLAIH